MSEKESDDLNKFFKKREADPRPKTEIEKERWERNAIATFGSNIATAFGAAVSPQWIKDLFDHNGNSQQLADALAYEIQRQSDHVARVSARIDQPNKSPTK